MTTTVGGGRLDHSAPGQATQHALLSLSFSLTALQQAGEGAAGGGAILPCHQPAEGSHPKVTTSSPLPSGGRFSFMALRNETFMNVV